MSRTIKKSNLGILAVGLIVSLMAGTALAGNPGDAGLLFLRMGVGAREAGMGNAGVAASEGAAAIFWNPANNVLADFQTDLVLQHQRWLGAFDHEAAAVAHRLGNGGVLGFIFSGLYSDDLVRYGTDGVAVAQGTFSPYDVAFGVSYAHPLGDRFGVGVTAKMIYERIDIYSDTGFAFDLSISHRAMIEGLVFAASATNLGGQFKLKDEPYDLPTAFRVGAAWTPVEVFKEKVTLAGDVFLPNDSNEKAHLGAEVRIIPEFCLRVGTKINYDLQGLTAGAGFRLKRLTVDYAYEDMTIEGFDPGHKFSLGLTW